MARTRREPELPSLLREAELQYRSLVAEVGDPRRKSLSEEGRQAWTEWRQRWGISPHTARKWFAGRGPETRIGPAVREAARQADRISREARKMGLPAPQIERTWRRKVQEIASGMREARRRGLPEDLARRGVQISTQAPSGDDRVIGHFRKRVQAEAWLRKSAMPLPAVRLYWNGDTHEWDVVVVATSPNPRRSGSGT